MTEVYHITEPTKRCARCTQEKPLSEFHAMKMAPDGLRPSCKSCRKVMDRQPKIIKQQPLFVFSKTCSKCLQEKPIEQFNKMSSMKDGHHAHCRECQSAYNHRHRTENLEAYRERDHAKNRKSETRARVMRRHRERSANDPRYLARLKRHRQKHYQSHKDQARDFYPRRKARILSVLIGEVNYARILERDGYICHICQKPIDPTIKGRTSKALSFDHVIPLKPRPGEPQGTHSEDNLKPAHFSCNVRKGNRPFDSLTSFDRRGV